MVMVLRRLTGESAEGDASSGTESSPQLLSPVAMMVTIMGDAASDAVALRERDEVRRSAFTNRANNGTADTVDASSPSALVIEKHAPSDSVADASEAPVAVGSRSGTKRPHASAFEGASEHEKAEKFVADKGAHIFYSPRRRACSVVTTIDGVDSSPSQADFRRCDRASSSVEAELVHRLEPLSSAGFSTPNPRSVDSLAVTSENSVELSTPQGEGSRIPPPIQCPGTPVKASFTTFISRLGGINGGNITATTTTRCDNVERETSERTVLDSSEAQDAEPEACVRSGADSNIPLASPARATLEDFRMPSAQAPRRPSGNLRRLFRPLDFGSAGIRC
ncbi:hypothetical protein CLOM_g5113 [Closterium sp. NIES-68]|nr:hypothetical protein CLOM_g5113 [Closterium sp. NIES-68]